MILNGNESWTLYEKVKLRYEIIPNKQCILNFARNIEQIDTKQLLKLFQIATDSVVVLKLIDYTYITCIFYNIQIDNAVFSYFFYRL